jgi:hypothetical protein
MSTFVQVLARLVFGLVVLFLFLGLMAVGVVVAAAVLLVSLVTRRKPQWGTRAQHWGQQAWRRYGATRGDRAAPPAGEVVDAEVREIR